VSHVNKKSIKLHQLHHFSAILAIH
jgi:hypothetical protein